MSSLLFTDTHCYSFRDNRKNTPCCVASTKDVRDAFRRFRGRFPDRYDYHHAQVTVHFLFFCLASLYAVRKLNF